LEAVKLEGKGIDRELGSLEAVKLEGKRIGDAREQLIEAWERSWEVGKVRK
jgi:hypothetical protein